MDRGAMPRILVCDPLDEEALDLLNREAQVDIRTGLTPDELVDIVAGYDALVVRSSTQVTSEVIEAGSQLRAIARAGVGVDTIDVDAATEHGVVVVNAPGASAQAVVELTFGLILTMLRRLYSANRTTKAGRWEKSKLRGRQIAGQTLGVVGYGRIGREVSRIGQAFGARVITATLQDRPPEYAERVDFDRLLAESDIITLHVPLTAQTASMIDAEAIRKMKDGVYLVNTSRGGIVDEAALLEGLNSGKVAGAALDVFAVEPPGESELVKHPRVVVTPHIGGSTLEAQRAVGMIAVRGMLAVLRGERTDTVVNPRAF